MKLDIHFNMVFARQPEIFKFVYLLFLYTYMRQVALKLKFSHKSDICKHIKCPQKNYFKRILFKLNNIVLVLNYIVF